MTIGDEKVVSWQWRTSKGWNDCGNCEYRFQKSCDEETLEERWNKLSRKNMPAYVEPEQ